MKRRELLAIGGIGITATAGCYGISQALSSDEEEEASENSSQGGNPDIGANQDDNTDSAPSEPEEIESQSQDNETTAETNESGEQNTTDTPGGNPVDAVAIADDEMIFDEAVDPNYETDELYIQAMIRNTSDHDLKNIRLDGYAYAGDTSVGHEYLEYAALEAGGSRGLEIQFYVDDPAAVERYRLEVTAAQWA